jgi:Bacterial PH domain
MAANQRSLRGSSADSKVQTFRSPTAVVVWVVWLLFAVGNWIDLAVQGRDKESVVAAAILLLVTGFAYATAWRPRIIVDEAGVTVRNPLLDHRVGWASIAKVDLADLLRVHCEVGAAPATGGKKQKVISSWAVHYSRRRQMAAETRARRAASGRRSSFGMGGMGGGFGSRGMSLGGSFGGQVTRPAASDPAEAEAEKIARLLSDRAATARSGETHAETQDETLDEAQDGTQAASGSVMAGWLEPLTSTWSGRALAAIGIPALIVLIVCLL